MPPANIYAVGNDHDYLVHHPEDLFYAMCVRTISENQIQQIEFATRGQNKNSKWMTERSRRVISSNFGRIGKCTDRTDKLSLARSYLTPTHIDVHLRHGLKY